MATNLTCSSCDAIYSFIQKLLVDLNVTTECCLGNDSNCSNATDGQRTNAAKGDRYARHFNLLSLPFLTYLFAHSQPYTHCSLWLWFPDDSWSESVVSAWSDSYSPAQQKTKPLPLHQHPVDCPGHLCPILQRPTQLTT